MKFDREALLSRYRQMPSDELLEILETGDLTEHARVALLETLDEKGVDPEIGLRELADREPREAAIKAPIASLGARFSAQIVDGVIAANIILWPAALFGDDSPIVLAALFGFALYLLFQDGLKGGQSLGKRMLMIAVINKTTGKPCNFSTSFLRNAVLLFFGYVDVLFLASQDRRRLGDLAANTIVVEVGVDRDSHENPF